jgi:hypothetical protein
MQPKNLRCNFFVVWRSRGRWICSNTHFLDCNDPYLQSCVVACRDSIELSKGSNPSCPASDFFQYFNPSNACLQAVDLIEFFLPKLFAFLKKVPLLWGTRTVETAFCSKPLDLARSEPEFEPYRLHAVLCDSAHQHEPKKYSCECQNPVSRPKAF